MLGTDVIGPGLRDLAERHPSIGEVRGLGVFWALELVKDRATREPLVPFNAAGAGRRADGRAVSAACKAAGPVAVRPLQPAARGPAGHDHRRRRPQGLAILDEALEVADAHSTAT